MERILYILMMIVLSNNALCQTLPSNFNLIPNSSFEMNFSGVVSDTDFATNKLCWIRANKSTPPIWYKTYLPKSRPRTGNNFGELILGYPRYRISTHQWI